MSEKSIESTIEIDEQQIPLKEVSVTISENNFDESKPEIEPTIVDSSLIIDDSNSKSPIENNVEEDEDKNISNENEKNPVVGNNENGDAGSAIVDENTVDNTIGDGTTTTATTTTTYRELTMNEIDELIKNREVKVSTILPNVPQTSGKRLRMLIVPQKEYDALIGECTGIKYGSYERPEYHFHVIGSKQNISFPYTTTTPKSTTVDVDVENVQEKIDENANADLMGKNEKKISQKDNVTNDKERSIKDTGKDKKKRKEKKVKKSVSGSGDGDGQEIDFENDEITILFEKSACLYILSPQSVDALFLRLRNIPPTPVSHRGEVTFTGLVVRRGYWYNDDKMFVDCNREVQRVFQRLIKVHLLPQLNDANFVSNLLKRHALLVGGKKKRKKDKSKKKEK